MKDIELCIEFIYQGYISNLNLNLNSNLKKLSNFLGLK